MGVQFLPAIVHRIPQKATVHPGEFPGSSFQVNKAIITACHELLPIDSELPKVLEALESDGCVVVRASPGAEKRLDSPRC